MQAFQQWSENPRQRMLELSLHYNIWTWDSKVSNPIAQLAGEIFVARMWKRRPILCKQISLLQNFQKTCQQASEKALETEPYSFYANSYVLRAENKCTFTKRLDRLELLFYCTVEEHETVDSPYLRYIENRHKVGVRLLERKEFSVSIDSIRPSSENH